MDLADIRKLIRLMEKAELSELEIDDSKQGLRVHLKRATGSDPSSGSSLPIVQWLSPPAGGAAPAMPGSPPAPAADSEAPAGPGPGVEVVKSPMVGTFYRSPSPDAEVFTDLGTKVTEDSVLCIIEAMKVMNEIKSELVGEVVEILVENGEPVEFGQPLFHIKKG